MNSCVCDGLWVKWCSAFAVEPLSLHCLDIRIVPDLNSASASIRFHRKFITFFLKSYLYRNSRAEKAERLMQVSIAVSRMWPWMEPVSVYRACLTVRLWQVAPCPHATLSVNAFWNQMRQAKATEGDSGRRTGLVSYGVEELGRVGGLCSWRNIGARQVWQRGRHFGGRRAQGEDSRGQSRLGSEFKHINNHLRVYENIGRPSTWRGTLNDVLMPSDSEGWEKRHAIVGKIHDLKVESHRNRQAASRSIVLHFCAGRHLPSANVTVPSKPRLKCPAYSRELVTVQARDGEHSLSQPLRSRIASALIL